MLQSSILRPIKHSQVQLKILDSFTQLELYLSNKKQDLKIFVPKDIYSNIVTVANTKKHRSKIPYGYDLFLEKTYTKYSYLKKSGLKRLVYHLLQTMGKRLREGHELRMVSDKGEVRLFRPLGPIHDKVMRKVYRKYKNERTINK